jgi:alpha-beta hydrolase superfamily lysophospholipase
MVVLPLVLAACATPHVQRTGEATTAPKILPHHIRTADADRLPLSVWRPEGEPRAVVLGLHGFNDYRRGFEETGEFLAARGFLVYAYDQRGFGGTAHARLWFGGEAMAEDARTVSGLLRRRHPGLPLYLIGESMGAAVALVAANGGLPIDGLVLLAPAVWGRSTMPALQRGALWFASHTFPSLTLSPRGLDIKPTDNKAARRKLREDPLVIKETRTDALWGIAELMDRALVTAPPPDLPTLILYGRRDEIIPKPPTCRWLAGLPGSPAHRLAVYPDGWHMLTRDLQAETVLTDIASWLADPLAAPPSGVEVQGGLPRFCSGMA